MPYSATSRAGISPVRTVTPRMRLPLPDDPDTLRVTEALKQQAQEQLAQLILRGVVVDATLVGPVHPATGEQETTITHGLGRLPVGVMVIRCRGACPWFYEVTGKTTTSEITFASLTACAVTLLVW